MLPPFAASGMLSLGINPGSLMALLIGMFQ
jgi:hypothetical protein